MGSTITAAMTFEEFERLPDEPNSLELLRGELIRMPPPKRVHQNRGFRLASVLNGAVERARADGAALGEVCHEMDYLMSDGPSWLQPDVSINFPNQPGDEYCEGSPMLVFEIVSPCDRASELEEKVEEFLRCGALEVWIIYPESRHAIVHDKSKQARREARAIRSPHLPSIEIPFEQFL